MKKLTASIFATLLAVVSVDAAQASIASKGYVDDQVGTVSATVATKADKSTVDTLSGKVTANENAIGQINTTIGGYGDIVTHNVGEFATSAQGALADTAVQPSDITDVERTTNKTTSISGTSTDTQYPSAKAVYTAIENATADIATDTDLSALTTRVTTAEGDIDTLQSDVSGLKTTKADKTELANYATTEQLEAKADKSTTLAGYGITDAYTKSQVDSALSEKQATLTTEQQNAVNSGITKEKVTTYDGYAAQIAAKADASALANYVTTEDANTNYAVKGTEGIANTASTNAQQALTNIGTLTNLTTDAKTNTVAAINEVATEAATAQSTATAAQSAAGTAQAAAEAAQGDVDALEVRVGTAESDIDGIQEQIGNMATSEVVEGLKTDVEGLKTNKLDKSVYDSQVGTVSAGNMGTTATTVVTAIKEVAGKADAAQSAASAADSKAQTAQSAAEAADSKAQAAQETASAAIPKPTGTCSNPTAKCVLTYNNSQYTWEVIERGEDGE